MAKGKRAKPRRKTDKTIVGIIATTCVVALLASTSMLGISNASDSLYKSLTSQFTTDEDVQHPSDTDNTPALARIDTPAYKFLNNMQAKDQNLKENASPSVFGTWVCGINNAKFAPITGYQDGLGNKTSLIINVYGAGQSSKALEEYRNSIARCTNRDGSALFQNRWAPLGLNDADGFAFYLSTGKKNSYINTWTRGDVLISVSSPNLTGLNKTSQELDKKISEELLVTECLSLSTSIQDAQRSPFYDPESYEGWNKGRKVTITKNAFGVRVGVLSKNAELTGEGNRLGKLPKGALEDNAEISTLPEEPTLPESPLPEDDEFPSSLPKKVAQPGTKPVIVSMPETTAKIQERVEDVYGPGCGWAWSGQKAPQFDSAEEKARADADARKAAEKLRKSLALYLDETSGLKNAIIEYNRSVYLWNKYVQKYSEVAQKWNELNQNRADFRRELDAYYARVANREEFIEKKQNAQEEYDKIMLTCVREEDIPPTTPPTVPPTTPPTIPPTTPPTIPPTTPPATLPPTTDPVENESLTIVTTSNSNGDKVVVCPKRPKILDQDAPDVPEPPQKPDFPLPVSWDDLPW